MATTYPKPPNPWPEHFWLEMTRGTIWRVWGSTTDERCVLEVGDDAWTGGKASGPVMCEDLYAQILPPKIPFTPFTPEEAAQTVAAFSPGTVLHPTGDGTPGGAGAPGGGFIGFPGVVIPGDSGTPSEGQPDGPGETPGGMAPIPLPASVGLLLAAMAAFGLLRKKRR